jgi:hypothetical protein
MNITRSQAAQLLQEVGFPLGHWCCQIPERIINEIEKMERNTNARYYIEGDDLIFVENIITNFGTSYGIAIVVSSGYPYVQPKAYAPGIATTKHIFSDGSLCLFAPTSYKTNMSLLDIRNQTCAWCFAYEAHRATGEWPAAEEKH